MNEIWKDIKGYESLYQVSNLGRVKSLSRYHWNGNSWWKSKDRILKPRTQKDKKHYYSVQLVKNKSKTNKNIHRLVAEAFIPNPEGKLYVNHKDDDKFNNKAENLEWCTPTYNSTYGKMTDINRRKRKRILFVDDKNNISFVLDKKEDFKKCGFIKESARTSIRENRKYFDYKVYYIND